MENVYDKPLKDIFSDINPIPLDVGSQPAISIQYTTEYIEVMDLFRAIMAKDERSDRALYLTTKAIEINPANYTAWYYRRLCIEAIHSDMHSELLFCNKIAEDSSKNYQLWNHRRWVIESLNDPVNELSYSAGLLTEDEKNYHVWAHRQWVLTKFSLWGAELSFVNLLLSSDPYNNSAWNQRYYTIKNTSGFEKKIDSEIEYVKNSISNHPDNESSWNYFYSLLHFLPSIENVMTFIQSYPDNRFPLSILVDLARDKIIDKGRISGVLKKLISLDPTRKAYWEYRESQLK